MNVLCHNSMLHAYGAGLPKVTLANAQAAVADYEDLFKAAEQSSRPRPVLRVTSLNLSRAPRKLVAAVTTVIVGVAGFGIFRHASKTVTSASGPLAEKPAAETRPGKSDPKPVNPVAQAATKTESPAPSHATRRLANSGTKILAPEFAANGVASKGAAAATTNGNAANPSANKDSAANGASAKKVEPERPHLVMHNGKLQLTPAEASKRTAPARADQASAKRANDAVAAALQTKTLEQRLRGEN
jgi:hypothetical protein